MSVRPPFYHPLANEQQVFRVAFDARVPVMLTGPTGCGKTRLGEHMASGVGQPLITITCHDDLTSADLLGRFLVKSGDVEWVEGPLTRAVREGAGCYLDEEGFFYTEGNGAGVRGDSNGDATLDISDPILMLGRLFLGGLPRETCASALAVNADGAFDISDPIILLRFLFQGDVVLTPPLATSPELCP